VLILIVGAGQYRAAFVPDDLLRIQKANAQQSIQYFVALNPSSVSCAISPISPSLHVHNHPPVHQLTPSQPLAFGVLF